MSDQLVDPLKVHTMGVKKPLEEKKDRIRQYYEEAKRYYPSNERVSVDEWGAVIKNQSEAFRRMEDEQKRARKAFQQDYGQELESEVFNKLKKSKEAEMTEKQKEYQLALQKKNEYDNIQMNNQERKKQMQHILADDYERMIKMKQDKSMYDKTLDLENGKVANQKALKELQYIKMGDDQKKQMIKEILTNDKQVHDGNKFKSYRDGVNSKTQAQKDLELMELRARQRDQAFQSRYNNFNDFQKKIAQSYSANVINPTVEKEMTRNQIQRKQEFEMKRRADQIEEIKNKTKKDWAMDNRRGLEKQINDKTGETQAVAAQHRFDEDKTRAIERDFNSLQMLEKSEKKARQQVYKEMLDNQYKIRQNLKLYGNMTGIEKQINKNELSAFKNYDNNTYALIPGLNSVTKSPSKKVMDAKMNKTTRKDPTDIDHRMNQYGFTRDVTLIKNPALISKNAHRSSYDDISGHMAPNTTRPDVRLERKLTSPTKAESAKLPFSTANVQLNSINNFNNHHLYQSYNPITGAYNPDKQQANQMRTTFRYAANNVLG